MKAACRNARPSAALLSLGTHGKYCVGVVVIGDPKVSVAAVGSETSTRASTLGIYTIKANLPECLQDRFCLIVMCSLFHIRMQPELECPALQGWRVELRPVGLSPIRQTSARTAMTSSSQHNTAHGLLLTVGQQTIDRSKIAHEKHLILIQLMPLTWIR